MSDIFISIIAVLLQTRIRTIKEGSDIAQFVIIMMLFSIKIYFTLTEEARKIQREKEDQDFFDKYKKQIIEKHKEQDETRTENK